MLSLACQCPSLKRVWFLSQIPATGATCGNKVVETGEECDCGTVDECQADTCCDPITCKFAEGAECARGPCCTPECKVRCATCCATCSIPRSRDLRKLHCGSGGGREGGREGVAPEIEGWELSVEIFEISRRNFKMLFGCVSLLNYFLFYFSQYESSLNPFSIKAVSHIYM